MPEDADEPLERNQRAVAAAAGALVGSAAGGPLGAVVGAALGPMLEPLVREAWAELSESARRRQIDVLASAIHAGIPVDEMEERINASERTKLLTGFALSAATRTAWEDKVRTLGRSLASGLLADDDAMIDTEQMIIAAITDIEGPQLAMLELLVCWYPCQTPLESSVWGLICGPLDLPSQSQSAGSGGSETGQWPYPLIVYARPKLFPVAPGLLGTLQRHGLIVQNAYTDEKTERFQIEQFFQELEKVTGRRFTPEERSGRYGTVSWPEGKAPLPRWSRTQLGEQVFLRFRDAGTELTDVWKSGPAG